MKYKNYSEYKQNRKKINFEIIKEIEYTDSDINIAIIIPERNRLEHLKKFINRINNFDKFNRGLLLNIGYYIAKKNKSYDRCKSYDRYILHDVDSYPDQDLFNLYFSNLDKNIHYASPYLDYKYKFDNFLGGVFGINSTDFEKINGFPNNFFG